MVPKGDAIPQEARGKERGETGGRNSPEAGWGTWVRQQYQGEGRGRHRDFWHRQLTAEACPMLR